MAALAAVALVASVVAAYFTLPDSARDSYDQLMGGLAGRGLHRLVLDCRRLRGAVPGAAFLAVRLVPTWPEMGSRYDAPGAREPRGRPGADAVRQDLWEALDEGRDPTDTNQS